jgi:aspartate carbamoyltransferase catalytic subunit
MTLRRHLLGISTLDRAEIEELLSLASRFAEVCRRPIPRVPALRGRSAALMFFENSTRTRLSFERAAKALSAETLSFGVSGSSMSKGESLVDTAATVAEMGAEVLIIRHEQAGVPWLVARELDVSVINAGDGCHEHPTQALADCMSLLEERSRRGETARGLQGLRVGIVGDVEHSRVARSDALAFRALGAEVTLVGPPTLMPRDVSLWGTDVAWDLDELLGELDVVYLLRLQLERLDRRRLGPLDDYIDAFSLTKERLRRMKEGAVVMHPGPINRGVEISDEAADGISSRILDQVRNGIPVRMAALWWAFGVPGKAQA